MIIIFLVRGGIRPGTKRICSFSNYVQLPPLYKPIKASRKLIALVLDVELPPAANKYFVQIERATGDAEKLYYLSILNVTLGNADFAPKLLWQSVQFKRIQREKTFSIGGFNNLSGSRAGKIFFKPADDFCESFC